MFDGISVNGKSVIGRFSAIIDIATTLVIGDAQSVQAIYDQIPGSQDAGDGIWTSAFVSWLAGRSTDRHLESSL